MVHFEDNLTGADFWWADWKKIPQARLAYFMQYGDGTPGPRWWSNMNCKMLRDKLSGDRWCDAWSQTKKAMLDEICFSSHQDVDEAKTPCAEGW